ncbi:MAG: ATP synthase F0 subunit B [bacterium]
MDSLISTFHIDWKIIIAQAVNFAIVFVVLYIFALKPLVKLMAERAEKIAKGISDAKKSDELMKTVAEEQKENIIKLRKMSIDAQKELKKDLQKLKEEHVEEMTKDTEEWKKNRLKQMEIDKQVLIESAKKDVMHLAVLAAEKIMQDKNR